MRGLNLEDVLEMIRGLPGLPETHVRVMALAADSDSSTSDIADVVRTDTALAARVLQVANTPFYGMNGRIESVTRAVVVLGARTVCSLAIGAGMVDVLRQHDPREECGIDVWKHCLQSAIGARALAEHNGTIDPDVAFTGGLLHDMGKLVLSTMFPEAYRNVLDEHAVKGTPLTNLEDRVFGIDHAHAGAVLCTTWNLPTTIRRIVESHHATPARQQDVDFAVACGSVLARLVTPRASGEIHIRESELTALLTLTRRTNLLRRLVVSQSMQPPVMAGECESAGTLIDVEHNALREGISLVALACGFTPVSSSESDSGLLVISDSESVLRHDDRVCLSDIVSQPGEEQLLNVSALHRRFLFHSTNSCEAQTEEVVTHT